MSVVKSKRKPSSFEVFHHLVKLRKDITDFLLRDFGYSSEKFDLYLDRRFGNKTYEELTELEKVQYDQMSLQTYIAHGFLGANAL